MGTCMAYLPASDRFVVQLQGEGAEKFKIKGDNLKLEEEPCAGPFRVGPTASGRAQGPPAL